jgi:hypothetical protein
VPLDAQSQGLEPAQQEISIMGACGPAQHTTAIFDLGNQFPWAHHRAGQQIVVAAQVLGGAVDDQVHAELKRPLVDRCGKGAVHNQDQIAPPGDINCSRQV